MHRQEGAISRLHQRSRDCFRQLKAAQAPPHPTHQPHIPLQERELHAQPSASIAGAHSADVQPMNGMQGVQEEQQGQMDVLAKESEGRQRRCASPLKGTAPLCVHLRTCLAYVYHSHLNPITYPTDHLCYYLWFMDGSSGMKSSHSDVRSTCVSSRVVSSSMRYDCEVLEAKLGSCSKHM